MPDMESIDAGQGPEASFALECARAKGEQTIPDEELPHRITGAFCDYSARGACREHWFRMVWRNDAWEYFSEHLAAVGMNSSTRHQSTSGNVWAGELVATHDRGKPIEAIALVTSGRSRDSEGELRFLKFGRRRDGQLSVTLPDSSVVLLPDPRKR